MTKEELISKGKYTVRNDKNLMLAYIELFESEIGRRPQCAGCTFNSDWEIFVKKGSAVNKIIKIMNNKKYNLHKAYYDVILFYRKEGSNKPYRIYGKNITDEFAKDYLTFGTEKEIEERKKYFETIPEEEEDKEEEKIIKRGRKPKVENAKEELEKEDS